jgi:hypothetical protein
VVDLIQNFDYTYIQSVEKKLVLGALQMLALSALSDG